MISPSQGFFIAFFMGDREIIYLALCNQINLYYELLEDPELSEQDRGMATYILNHTLKLEEAFRDKILNNEDENIELPNENQGPERSDLSGTGEIG